MSSSHRLLKAVRLTHLYLGVFITPMLLFFAFTGFVQSFNLHETLKGRNYTPPAILVKLGQLHKKQTLVVPARKAPGPEARKPEGEHKPETAKAPEQPQYPWAMKIFFGLVSIGLGTSTLTGLYMSYKYVRNKVMVTILLVAGVVVPVVLLAF